MLGIVLFTHGSFGKGIIHAANLILGEYENIRYVSLNHGDGVEQFETECRNAINEVDSGDGVVCLVDFVGGTPFNIAAKIMQTRKDLISIIGFNMPMLVELIANIHEYNLINVEEELINIGTSNICSLNKILNNNDTISADNDF